MMRALPVALALGRPALATGAEATLELGRFGPVAVHQRAPQPANVVLFVAGDGGWSQGAP